MSFLEPRASVPTLIIGYARGYRHPAHDIKVAGRDKTCTLSVLAAVGMLT